jgi:hypothetical protein
VLGMSFVDSLASIFNIQITDVGNEPETDFARCGLVKLRSGGGIGNVNTCHECMILSGGGVVVIYCIPSPCSPYIRL